MERLRLSIVTGLLCSFALAACNENPNDVKRLNGVRGTVVTSTQSLDQSIRALLARFPKNLDQRDPDSEGADLNPRATWDQITKKYATGLSKPAHMVIAKRKLVRLSDWATRNAQMMITPPADPEPKASAAARLVLYMNMYVYGGPGGTPPDFIPGADVAVGVVTPDAPATIVTPTKHAGVQFEAGSVDENTVVVVTQNPNVYRVECSGPLTTKLCQYPQFYTFDQFPHKALLKPAKFNVCHVNTGDTRRPLADHDRLRLAHEKPASPTDYTNGSTIRDNIEILPLAPQTFSTCEGSTYEADTEIGLADDGLFSRLARSVRKIVTPKTAYAIDLGLGGLSKSFSAFNDVDPLGRPDLSVLLFTVGSDCGETGCVANPGGQVRVTYRIKNIGTAMSSQVSYAIRLVSIPANLEDPVIPVRVQVFSGLVSALSPSATQSNTQFNLPIPATVQPGSYNMEFVVGDNESFSEDPGTLANNAASAAVILSVPLLNLGTLPGDDISQGVAINDAGHIVGISAGASERPFLWVSGQMTSLGTLGGDAEPAAINNDDEVVGVSRIGTGEIRAFRWKNGAMTNLGTLPGTNWSAAIGINSAGQILGWSNQCAGSPANAFLGYCTGALTNRRMWIWQNGLMTDLGGPAGFDYFSPQAINDAGQITGYGGTNDVFGVRAWVWQNGNLTIISSPTSIIPADINDVGVVVGQAFIPGGQEEEGVRWANGTLTNLGRLPGDDGSVAAGVSHDGQIVGVSLMREPVTHDVTKTHAFLWRAGQMIDLGGLGGNYSNAVRINDVGQIIGSSMTLAGKLRATVWQAPPLN